MEAWYAAGSNWIMGSARSIRQSARSMPAHDCMCPTTACASYHDMYVLVAQTEVARPCGLLVVHNPSVVVVVVVRGQVVGVRLNKGGGGGFVVVAALSDKVVALVLLLLLVVEGVRVHACHATVGQHHSPARGVGHACNVISNMREGSNLTQGSRIVIALDTYDPLGET